MKMEIERKFLIDWVKLVQSKEGARVHKTERIIQGYLFDENGVSMRIRKVETYDRIMDLIQNVGYIVTIKKFVSNIENIEYEYEVEEDFGESMLDLCKSLISKWRYTTNYLGDLDLNWEIDVFYHNNAQLYIAEIELPSPDIEITLPDWIIKEVTDDLRYKNSNLAKNPYSTWGKDV